MNATNTHETRKGLPIFVSTNQLARHMHNRFGKAIIGLLCIAFLLPAITTNPGDRERASFPTREDFSPLKASNIGIETWNRTWSGPVTDAWGMCKYGENIYTVGRSAGISLIKWQVDGSKAWNRTWGPIAGAQGYGVYSDGSFVYTCGYTVNPVTLFDLVVVQWTMSGDVVWNATWGGTGTDIGYGITCDESGIYVVGGTTSFKSRTDEDIVLVHLDVNGTILQNTTWATPNVDRGYDVLIVDDAIYISGYTGNGSAQDMLLARFERDLTRSMNATWGFPTCLDGGYKAWSDGTFIYVVGQTAQSYSDLVMVKWTTSGMAEWNVTWGGSISDVGVGISGHGSEIVTVGYSDSFASPGEYDVVILRWSSDGYLLENITMAGAGADYAWDCTYDGYTTQVCGQRYVNETWVSFIVAYSATDAQVHFSKRMVFSEQTPFSDYNVRLDLDPATFNYSACSAGGANIRFYDQANASLSYWIESWDPLGSSTVWIKVPDAGTSWIMMECGPFFLPAASEGDTTFPFFDDFSSSSVDASKWVVYEDTYSHVTVSGGMVNITMDTPNNTFFGVEFGFSNTHAVSGATFGSVMDDRVAFASNVTTTMQDYTVGSPHETSVDYNFYKRWITSEIAWINSSIVNFWENSTLISTHTNASTIPTDYIPLHILAMGCYSGPGTWWCGYIASVNATMGQPGMAMRSRQYAQYSVQPEPAMILADWVFTRKCVEVEPVVFFDVDPPIIGASCAMSISIKAGAALSITWSISDDSSGTYEIMHDGSTMLDGTFDRHASIVTSVNTSVQGLTTYTIRTLDISGNEAQLSVIITVIGESNNPFIFIIIFIGIVTGAAIVASGGYSKRKTRITTTEKIGKKAGTRSRYGQDARRDETLGTIDAKRARLLKLPPVDTSCKVLHDSPFTSKRQAVPDEYINVQAREANLNTMAGEVEVRESSINCIVHKGPVAGFGFTCPQCGVHYCIPCVKHVTSTDGKCWNCKNPIDASISRVSKIREIPDSNIPLPRDDVTIFTRDIWEKIRALQVEGWITSDILPEVLTEIKSLPPQERMEFLDGLPSVPKTAFHPWNNDYDEEEDKPTN